MWVPRSATADWPADDCLGISVLDCLQCDGTGTVRNDRYPRIVVNGQRRRVHVLMAETWLGPRPFGMQVLHADDRPANTRISNISYGTPAQNAADRASNHRKENR